MSVVHQAWKTFFIFVLFLCLDPLVISLGTGDIYVLHLGCLVQSPVVSVPSCVILGRVIVPQELLFLHLLNGGSTTIYNVGLKKD